MQEFKSSVESMLKQFKTEKSLELPIFKDSKKIGYLKPIKYDEDDAGLIKLLSEWREKYMQSYPTWFKVTEEGTKKWLKTQVINKEDRILFMVYDNDLNPIGHMGLALFNYYHRFCEIDNVVRGSEKNKGIMTFALNTLINWGFKELNLSFFNLRVFSDNPRAIELYHRCGFEEIRRIPLERINEGDNVYFVEIPYGSRKQPDKYFVLMNLQNYYLKTLNSNKMILTAGPSISEKEIDYVTDAVKNGWNFEWNKYIKKFESKFAEYIGVKYALSTSCGTGALHVSLLALGIKPGDEVILPDLSWVAAASTVCYCGAKPIFADIDKNTWCLDPNSLNERITENTKAIIPVHSYGYPADMDKINKIAEKHSISVLEDAAPSVGSRYKGKKTGSMSDIAAFSFQGAKIMVTGEGGMVVTDNETLYKNAQFINAHGRDPNKQFWINKVGYKYAMSNIQAALGLAQLERIEGFVEKKRRIFNWYRSRLNDVEGIRFVKEFDGILTNHWMTSIILENYPKKRDKLVSLLKEKNIDSRVFFYPNSMFSFFKDKRTNNPVSYYISENGINLPSGVNLTETEVDYIADSIRKALKTL